jgi:hypothetical protein
MESGSDHSVPFSPITSDQSNERSLTAQLLFGRGFRQIAWLMVVSVAAGDLLANFAGTMLHAWLHSGKVSQALNWDFGLSLILDVTYAVALCWLLANVRNVRWLFLGVVMLETLQGDVWEATLRVCDVVRNLWHGYSSSYYTFGEDWRILTMQTVWGLTGALIVLVALKLRRRSYFLIPVICAGLHCAAQLLLWQLLIRAGGGHFVSQPLKFRLLLGAVAGIISGTGLWVGIEFQHRKQIFCERLTDARLSKGAYIFLVACGHLLALTLLLSATEMRGNEVARDIIGWLAILGLLAVGILFLVFLYRAWAAIETPFSIPAGSVIWKLFIPFYNFYWIFQAVPGFASEYENFVNYHELKLPKVRRGWLIAYVIITLPGFLVLRVFAVIPEASVLVLIYGVAVSVSEAVVVSRIADAVNRIPLELADPRTAHSPSAFAS